MNLKTLRWVAIVLPTAFLVLLQAGSFLLAGYLPILYVSLLVLAITLTGVVVFSIIVFRVLERMQRRIIDQNTELSRLHIEAQRRGQHLEALNEAGISMTAELSLEAVLQKVVDLSRELSNAKYGALGVFGEDGEIAQFVTSGITQEERKRLSKLPKGLGVLGLLQTEKKPIRIANLSQHPKFAGFPPNHPKMTSFMGVPIVYKGRGLGNLYLTDKQGAQEFIEEDEKIMIMFATQAAIAIENAVLYEKVQRLAVMEERDRISKDLHDGIIQSIFAVGLSLEDVAETSGRGPEEAKERLYYAIEGLNDVIRDIRNYILDLRPQLLQGKTLTQGLQELTAEFQVNSLMNLELKVDGTSEILLPAEETVNILQITREALNNVIKHAKATHALLYLEVRDGKLKVCVKDNGVGFNPEAARSSQKQGVVNMHQRAEVLGGKLTVLSSPGFGTEVTLELPLQRKAGNNN